MTALGTGMHRAEIFHLPWRQIGLNSAQFQVFQQEHCSTKERREKIVPMPAFLADYLRGQAESYPGEVWLLDDGQGHLAYRDPISFSTAFARHYRRLGVTDPGRVIHGFRALRDKTLGGRIGPRHHPRASRSLESPCHGWLLR
jgi:integrase